mgnify:FL=1|tara:strand:+ start:608 stop:787 length:180 start_codon:yes stop_codon:yes gene_type:complete
MIEGSRHPDVVKYYYVLFGKEPESMDLSEILAEIHQRNPQVYDMLYNKLWKKYSYWRER